MLLGPCAECYSCTSRQQSRTNGLRRNQEVVEPACLVGRIRYMLNIKVLLGEFITEEAGPNPRGKQQCLYWHA